MTRHHSHIHPQVDFHAGMNTINRGIRETADHHIHSQITIINSSEPKKQLLFKTVTQLINFFNRDIFRKVPFDGSIRNQQITLICPTPTRTELRISGKVKSTVTRRTKFHSEIFHLII